MSLNKEVNSYKYIPDPKGADYWKTPEEFYRDGGGDCEDFAIVKYHELKEAHDVDIVVGFLPSGQAHAVLVVDKKFVLDNRMDEIHTWQSTEFYPVYRTTPERGLPNASTN